MLNERRAACGLRSVLMLAIAVICLSSCSGSSGGAGEIPEYNPSGSVFEKFADAAEFGGYIEWVESEKENSGSSSGVAEGQPDSTGDSAPVAYSPGRVETNNQSENVDEGDIIKFAGDRLIILRDQHLIVLDIGGEHRNNPAVLDDKELDIDFGSGNWGKGAWYDEMLVFDSSIVLIAYRFHATIADLPENEPNEYTGAIEILNFSLGEDGQIGDGSRMFIESDDYYSGSTNYATRKIGDKLVVYAPFYTRRYVREGDTYRTEPKIPHVLELVNASQKVFRRARPAIDYSEIYKGSPESSGHILHSIFTFDAEGNLDAFDASGVMGDYSRVYYVTDEHLYLNIAQWRCSGSTSTPLPDKSTLYQFKIGESVHLKNIAEISGRVIERFAMQERSEKFRYVAIETVSGSSTATLRAASLNRDSFEDVSEFDVSVDTRWLNSVRFNGDFAVIAPYSYSSDIAFYLADFTKDVPEIGNTYLSTPDIFMMQPYSENRWIALGRAVGTSEYGYSSSIAVSVLEVSSGGALSRIASSSMGSGSVWSDAFQNDHAFFMDSENNLFAFPYSVWSNDSDQWQDGIVYFSISNDSLIQLGSGIIQTGDSCEECWYGNSRVVMRDDVYYNLLGRQLKVSNVDRVSGNMVDVSNLQLLEPVVRNSEDVYSW